MKGKVTINLRSTGTHQIVRRIEVRNLIVTVGVTELTKLVAGDNAVLRYLKRMQFGTGAGAPLITDTVLQVPINPIKDIQTITYPTTTSVRFDAYLTSSEANGFTLAEVGLLTVSGILFARAVYTPVTKTEDYQFEYQWTINT